MDHKAMSDADREMRRLARLRRTQSDQAFQRVVTALGAAREAVSDACEAVRAAEERREP